MASPCARSLVPHDAHMPQLPDHKICARCHTNGACHRRHGLSLNSWLRIQPDSANTLLGVGTDGGLSTTPMSASVFAIDKYKNSGGLDKMATTYDDSVINIGRDCGGIPDTGPLHRCPADLCNHDLPTAAAQSLLKQLLACFSDFITALGGLTHVATTQPSRT